MEISALQVINTQNIPGASNSQETQGDVFSQILAKLTGVIDGEKLDLAPELLNLTELEIEQVEEEEEIILFNPMNIPWMLMNNEVYGNQQQLVSITEEIASLEPSLIDNTQVIENLNQEFQPIADLESDVNSLIPVEVDYKAIEKNLIKEETAFEGKTNMQVTQNDNEEIALNLEVKSIPKEELSFKEKSSPNEFTKQREEVALSTSKDNEMKFSAVLEGSNSQRVNTNQFDHELRSPRAIDFNENIQLVNETIIDLIDLSGNGEDNTMKVKLYPEELGFVDVTLKMEEGKLVARILVENEQVRELFNGHMNQLNDKLARQNINIERVEIDLNLNSNNSPNSSNNQNNNKNPFESNKVIISQKAMSEITRDEVQTNQAYGGNGLNILA